MNSYRLPESITRGNADSITASIIAFWETAPSSGDMIFDCQYIHICDSCGLKLLLTFHRRAIEEKRTLILQNPTTVLVELLSVVRLDSVFRMVKTEDVG